MTKDEALDLALEALESCGAGHIIDGGNQWHDEKLVDKAITAIKQARSAPVQASQIKSDVQEALFEATYLAGLPLAPLVAIEGNAGRHVIDAITPPAAQRQWVGLTDEERVDLWKATETDNRMVLIDAIEAKLKERNV
jgi:hypothetical protein